MRAFEITKENDAEHRETLSRTGFWGKQGAGCIIVARDTGRICLPHRSSYVEQPGTWGTWGGAIDSSEDPKVAAIRELREEAGYEGKLQLIPLYVFRHPSGFTYYNFLALVEEEFSPTLNWETQGFRWVEYGHWPEPLHNGLKLLLNHQSSVDTIKKYTVGTNLDEAEHDTAASEEIYSTLEKHGYELLGSGIDATVWAKKDSPEVIKIIMPEHGEGAGAEANTFYKFYEFCKKNPNLENLPKFVRIGGEAHSVFTADGRDYIMIGMERLKPIPHGSFAEAMVYKLSEFASEGLSWEDVHDLLRSEQAWDKWEHVDQEDMERRDAAPMPTGNVISTVDSWDERDSAKWGVLYSLMRLLYHTGRINKQAWDLHTENAMMRGNDMIVITDPWVVSEVE